MKLSRKKNKQKFTDKDDKWFQDMCMGIKLKSPFGENVIQFDNIVISIDEYNWQDISIHLIGIGEMLEVFSTNRSSKNTSCWLHEGVWQKKIEELLISRKRELDFYSIAKNEIQERKLQLEKQLESEKIERFRKIFED